MSIKNCFVKHFLTFEIFILLEKHKRNFLLFRYAGARQTTQQEVESFIKNILDQAAGMLLYEMCAPKMLASALFKQS